MSDSELAHAITIAMKTMTVRVSPATASGADMVRVLKATEAAHSINLGAQTLQRDLDSGQPLRLPSVVARAVQICGFPADFHAREAALAKAAKGEGRYAPAAPKWGSGSRCMAGADAGVAGSAVTTGAALESAEERSQAPVDDDLPDEIYYIDSDSEGEEDNGERGVECNGSGVNECIDLISEDEEEKSTPSSLPNVVSSIFAVDETTGDTVYINQTDRLEPGTRVEVNGLETRADLNGKSAKIVGFVAERERYQVEVDKGGEQVYVKPANVSKLLLPLPVVRPPLFDIFNRGFEGPVEVIDIVSPTHAKAEARTTGTSVAAPKVSHGVSAEVRRTLLAAVCDAAAKLSQARKALSRLEGAIRRTVKRKRSGPREPEVAADGFGSAGFNFGTGAGLAWEGVGGGSMGVDIERLY